MPRPVAALSLAVATGIVTLTGAAGAFGSLPAGAVAAVLAAAVAGTLALRRLRVALDSAAAPRALKIVSLFAVVVALVQFARLSAFIVDASRTGASTVPWSRWEVLHSCVTAYFVAGKAAPDVTNVYDDTLYSLPGDSSAPRRPRKLDGFSVDVYEYPPPFLLLPRALFSIAPDFLRFRMLWFALNAGVVLVVMLAVAWTPGARALVVTLLGWAVLGILVPVDAPLDPRVIALLCLPPQALAVALAVAGVRYGGGRGAPPLGGLRLREPPR